MSKSGNGEKNCPHKAVAVRYDEKTDSAPRVVAKGTNKVAKRIRQIAQEQCIPIRRDDDLVEFLAKIDLNQEIPGELYGAVAEILSWIYRAGESMKRESNS
ncbi:MAG: EscU/YscU/HrcU family type III secretion system export apparatus switch protein [Fibrobacterota bacterium]